FSVDDADYVIYGKYAAKGSTLTVEMRVLRMDPLALRAPIQESGPLESLMELHTRVLWRTLSSGNGHYALSLADFTKRQRPLRMDAFEQYARGLQAADPEAKLAHLHEAARLEPEWLDPIFALGEAYFSKKDYNAALACLRRAAELAPGEDDYSVNLGLLALESDDAAAAADYFREAAEREPDSAEDRALLILSLERAERNAEADQEREAAKEAFGP